MYIDWTDDLSVGVKEIDQQHKRFLVIINELYDALENQNEKTVLGDILGKLESYAMYHFMTEEKYMDELGFDGAEEHKAEHKSLSLKIADFRTEYQDDEEKYAQELLHFLKDWLTHHLMEVDKKYEQCFREHGLK